MTSLVLLLMFLGVRTSFHWGITV